MAVGKLSERGEGRRRCGEKRCEMRSAVVKVKPKGTQNGELSPTVWEKRTYHKHSSKYGGWAGMAVRPPGAGTFAASALESETGESSPRSGAAKRIGFEAKEPKVHAAGREGRTERTS